ncbi:hypothetical protein TCON_1591 [Astathelohania contejeani]|uniref:ATP synthase F0 subunit 6 n=1 Tax=Astathelohania contejeani TaxID=164912 RepID=A0ABQ7HYF7_9MICR|nr:hypothetical protein TCON_1591 [Thelohania contejeani]
MKYFLWFRKPTKFVFYNLVLLVFIFILPNHCTIKFPLLFDVVDLFIKNFGWLFIIFIRIFYLFATKSSFKALRLIALEILFYIINTSRGGFINLLTTEKLNISGHIFMFSFSSYLLLEIINDNNVPAKGIAMCVLAIYNILACVTIMVYHGRIECLIGFVIAILFSLMHYFYISLLNNLNCCIL